MHARSRTRIEADGVAELHLPRRVPHSFAATCITYKMYKHMYNTYRMVLIPTAWPFWVVVVVYPG